jgi:SH3-like domain-containing protein
MIKVQSEPRPILSRATVALLVIACLVAQSGQALAEADGPDYYRVVNVAQSDVLNIRAQPTAKARKIGEIPPGADCVRNLGCQGGLTLHEFTTLSEAQKAQRLRDNPRWCQVEYRGTTGWVAGRYLAEGSCSD